MKQRLRITRISFWHRKHGPVMILNELTFFRTAISFADQMRLIVLEFNSYAYIIHAYNVHRAFVANAKEINSDATAISRRNAYLYSACIPADGFAITKSVWCRFSYGLRNHRNRRRVFERFFVKPRLTRGVGLCVHAAFRHNKVGAYISCNPVSSFFFHIISSDATRHRRYAPPHFVRGAREGEIERNSGRNKKGSWRKYFDESPGAYETFFLREFQSARRVLCENLRGKMEKTLTCGATAARPSGHTIIRNVWATYMERVSW